MPDHQIVLNHATQLFRRYATDSTRVEPTTPLTHLSIDSLAFFEIVYALEEYFECELDEPTVAEIKTLDDLAKAIHNRAKYPPTPSDCSSNTAERLSESRV